MTSNSTIRPLSIPTPLYLIGVAFTLLGSLMAVQFTVYDEKDHECCSTPGCRTCETRTIDENQCVSFGYHSFAYEVQSLDTHGGCVKLWEAQNCTGEYVKVEPGSPCPQNDLSKCRMVAHNETWNSQLVGISGCAFVGDPTPALRLEGPGGSPAAPTTTITQTSGNGSVDFTVYDLKYHDCCEVQLGCRACESYSIGQNECVSFEYFDFWYGVSSIKPHAECVRIWEAANCCGDSLQIEPGSECSGVDLSLCDMETGNRTWDDELVGVSGCGFVGDSKPAPSLVGPRTSTWPFGGPGFTVTPTTSTLNSTVNFTVYAEKEHDCCETKDCRTCESFSIAGDQCVSFGWFGFAYEVSSINSSGDCVRIWEAANCTGESLQIEPGSSCPGNDLSKCIMKSGDRDRDWDNELVGVSGCMFDGNPTPAPRLGPGGRQARRVETNCPNGTWVMEVRVRTGYQYGLELDCYVPGAETKTTTIFAARGLPMGKNVLTKCDQEPMKGVAFYIEDGVVYGYCQYQEHENQSIGSLCGDPKTGVCGVIISTGESEIIGGPNCCPVPNPGTTCTPTDKYETIHFDNINGSIATTGSYQNSVGIGLNVHSPEGSRLAKFYAGYHEWTVATPSEPQDLACKPGPWSTAVELASNFEVNLGTSSVTQYNWATNSSNLWKAQSSHTVLLKVPPGARAEIKQVVGVCGFLEVWTGQVQTAYFDRTGNELTFTLTSLGSKPTDETNSTTVTLLIGVGIPVVVLLTVCLVFVFCWHKKFVQKTQRRLTMEEVKRFYEGGPAGIHEQNGGYVPLPLEFCPYNREYEVVKGSFVIDFTCELGSGQYGVIYKGQLKQMNGTDTESGQGTIAVAVKTVRPNTPKEYFVALMSELKILAHIDHHQNIANLMGSYSENIKTRSMAELYVGVELCAGSLLKFLRHNRHTFEDFVNPGSESGPDSETEETSFNEPGNQSQYALPNPMTLVNLIQWATEIATGMEYLASKRVVHADLAARNVLLSFGFHVKICDFGLARQLVEYAYVKKEGSGECFLPWKWMALESLAHMQFTTMSDVWSFGVTCWEIFSLGAVPYPCLAWSWDFVDDLGSGQRLRKPQYASTHM